MKKVLFVSLMIAALFGCSRSVPLYILNANIVDVESGNILEDQYVEIKDGIITDIAGMSGLTGEPENSVDAESMYLTPGLSDMSVVISGKMTDPELWQIHPGDRMIAAGVTTVRNGAISRNPGALVENEGKYRGNETVGPDIIKDAFSIYSTGKDPSVIKREMESADADYLVTPLYIAPEQMDNILRYTDANNIYTCSTVYSFTDFNRCSSLGLDELSKLSSVILFLVDDDYARQVNWLDEEEYLEALDEYFSGWYGLDDEEILTRIEPVLSEVAGIMKKNSIGIATCLAPGQISEMKLDKPEEFSRYAEKYGITVFRGGQMIMKREPYGDHYRIDSVPGWVKFEYRINRIILSRLKEKGVMVTAGTEWTGRSWYGLAPGIALHDELGILTECGFSNLEALQAATLNASKVGELMGTDKKWGLIKTGFSADIIFTAENPLENIEVLREPLMVMKSGSLYDSQSLVALR